MSDEANMTHTQLGKSWEHNQSCRAGEHYDWTGGAPFKGEHVRRERVAADVIVEFCSPYSTPSYLGLCWEHYRQRRERHWAEWASLMETGHLRVHPISETAKRRGAVHIVRKATE